MIGIIVLLFLRRNEDIDDDNECSDSEDSSEESFFNLERIKQKFPLDKLSEDDILLALLVYLMF